MSWVLDHSKTTGATRLVMIGIANHVDARGEGWAYVAEVLRTANVSEKSYYRSVAEAKAMDELEVDTRAGGSLKMRGDRRPNMFRFPPLAATYEDSQERPPQDDHPVDERPPQDDSHGVDRMTTTDSGTVNDPSLFGAEQARTPTEPDSPKPRKPREPDPIWDAVLDACALTGVPPTKTERGAWNKAVAELRAVDATPDEVKTRAEAHRHKWPRVTLTPTSLARHWGEVAADQRAASDSMGPGDPGKYAWLNG